IQIPDHGLGLVSYADTPVQIVKIDPHGAFLVTHLPGDHPAGGSLGQQLETPLVLGVQPRFFHVQTKPLSSLSAETNSWKSAMPGPSSRSTPSPSDSDRISASKQETSAGSNACPDNRFSSASASPMSRLRSCAMPQTMESY